MVGIVRNEDPSRPKAYYYVKVCKSQSPVAVTLCSSDRGTLRGGDSKILLSSTLRLLHFLLIEPGGSIFLRRFDRAIGMICAGHRHSGRYTGSEIAGACPGPAPKKTDESIHSG
jgi:hypothetical protein